MNRGGRNKNNNAPEWFGGGFGATPSTSIATMSTIASGNDHSTTNDNMNTNKKSSKKKHRRSKSDVSQLKSSSRKAAERKEKRRSKEHRRGKSRDMDPNVDSLDLSVSVRSINSAGGGYSNSESISDLFQERHDTSNFTSPFSRGNSNANANGNGNGNVEPKQNKSRHNRRSSAPEPERKKSFLDRVFSFGRSNNDDYAGADSSKNNISAATMASTTTETPEASLHLHVHKMEEKFDPEEIVPLSSLYAQHQPQHNDQRQQIQQQQQQQHQQQQQQQRMNPNKIPYPQHHDHPLLYDQQGRLPFTYQKPNSNGLALPVNHVDDDLLSYSDDDTTGALSFQPTYLSNSNLMGHSPTNGMGSNLYPSYQSNEDMQHHESVQVMEQQRLMALSHSNSKNNLYPSYQSNESMQNHESYQVMQQQRLMALSQSNSKPSLLPSYPSHEDMQNHESFRAMQQRKMARSNSKTNLNNAPCNNKLNRYGAINTPNDIGPQMKDQLHAPQQQYLNPYRSTSNDMYFSEDDTNSSYHTQETYRNVDNFFFERTRPDDKAPLLHPMNSNSGDVNSNLFISPTNDEHDHLPNDVHHEESKLGHGNEKNLLDVTDHRTNIFLDEKRNSYKEAGRKEYQQYDVTASSMVDQSSRKSKNGSEENNSSGSSSSPLITPPSQTLMISMNNENKKLQTSSMHSSSHKPPSPPPPVSSVQILRTAIDSEIPSTSFSSLPRMSKSPSSSSTKLLKSKRTRKEMKRLRRQIERAETREDHVQFLLQDEYNDIDILHNKNEVINQLGSKEDNKAQDVPVAILFLLQLGTIIFLAIRYAGGTMLQREHISVWDDPYMYGNDDDPFSSGSPFPNSNSSPISVWAKDIYVDYTNALQLSCITGLYATVLSALSIGMMMILSTAFIPTVLCGTVLICIVSFSIMVALSPYTVLPVLALAALLISLGYSIVVWDHIPFASSNFQTALVGIKSSADILLACFAMMLVSFLWTITWMVAFLGIYDHYLDNAQHELSSNITWVGLSISLAMLVSYIWTFQVIMNIVHVTVAGVVGSWWTTSDSISSCCTHVFRHHFMTSITKSLGSICLGSLIVPPLGMLHVILLFICPQTNSKPRAIQINLADSNHDVNSMRGEKSVRSDISIASVYSQQSSPLDGIMRYFNDFGFTYVGIFSKSFIHSSQKATDVFKARGWSIIVSDRLIPQILRITSLLITLSSGVFGLVVEEYDGYSFTNFEKPTSTAFIIGCFTGFVLSSVCLKTIESAVNTIVVCFSVAPYAFKHYHPMLSSEMRASWGGIWLDEVSMPSV